MFQLSHNAISMKNRKKILKMESEQMISKQNTSKPFEQTPASQLSSAPKKVRLELACRKELRLFFQLKKAQKGCRYASQVKECLLLLLSMFKRHLKQPNVQDHLYSLSTDFCSIYKEQSLNWNSQKILQKQKPYIFILTILTTVDHDLPKFNIELLSCSGKNVYSKILFENWQIILSVFSQMNVKRENTLYIVVGRKNSQKFIKDNREFQNCLENFIDLQDAQKGKMKENFAKYQSKSIGSESEKVVQCALRQYFFIKSSLVRIFGWQDRNLTLSETLFLTILNNLIACLPISMQEGNLFDQIRVHNLTVCKAIQKSLKWDTDSFNELHFPTSLENAQGCWMCKKRVYIYCPTCTQFQKKRVSLCVQCYANHHHQNIKIEQPDFNLLDQWETMNQEIDSMLWQALREWPLQ